MTTDRRHRSGKMMMSGSGAGGPAVAARSLQQAQAQVQQAQAQVQQAQAQVQQAQAQVQQQRQHQMPLRPVSALALLRRKRRRYEQHGGLPAADNAIDASNGIDNGVGNGAAVGVGGNGAGPRLPPPLHLLLPPPPPPSAPAAAAQRPRQPQGGGSQSPAAAANLSSTSSAGRGVGVHGGSVGGVFEIGPGITEVSGEAGSGKTQLLLRMCVSCALTPYSNDGGGDGTVRELQGGTMSMPMTMPPVPAPAPAPAMVNSVRNPYAAPSQQRTVVPQQQYRQQNQAAAFRRPRQGKRCYRSVYVTMGEGLSPAQIAYRLGQMAEAAASATTTTELAGGNTNTNTGSGGTNAILRRILTRSVRNEDELLALVRNELPAMLRKGWDDDEEGVEDGVGGGSSSDESSTGGRIGLVVLDSIAGLFRLPDGGSAKDRTGTAFFARRSEVLFGLSAQLRKLGDQYGVAFVVANQVTAAGAGAGGGGGGPPSGGGNATIPALGLSWSNCVNARFALRRSETLSSRLGVSGAAAGSGASSTANGNGTHQQQPQPQAAAPVSMFRRWARVVKSPVLPPVSVPFTIDVRGGVAAEYPK